ncbi:MAG: hypothetical protein ABI267_05855 [Ginsengibacter sp.]
MSLFSKQIKNLLPAIILTAALFCFSCKKTIKNISQTTLEKYFSTYVIGNNFTVTLAKDSSDDITNTFDGYTFVLLQTDLYHGPLKATYGSQQYMGTWASNDDYSKLDISLPDSIPQFKFLSRSWRFTKKSNPTLQLAPWGSTAPIVLNMTRQ